MLTVITGGQTGADLAAWRAAVRLVAAGYAVGTGGWMPRGFRTEDGPRPEYARLYGAREHYQAGYPPRTRQNVSDSDYVLVFDASPPGRVSPGTRLAAEEAGLRGKPVQVLHPEKWEPEEVADLLLLHASRRGPIGKLMVGGNREPEPWRAVEELVFRALGIYLDRLPGAVRPAAGAEEKP